MSAHKKHIVVTLLSLFAAILVNAQTTIKVVTRTVNQVWETDEKSKVFINADKAKISVVQSHGNTLEVELKLIAKHVSADIAKKEAQYLKHSLTKKGNNYYLNNSILLPKNTSPESRLNAVYIIQVPKECEIQISNKLGNIYLSGLQNKIDLDIHYGNLYVKSCSGKLNVNTKVGDIEISNSQIETNLITEYSEINLNELNGKLKINARFGNIKLTPGNNLEEFIVNSHKSDVFVFNENCISLNLNIETSYGAINSSEHCYMNNSEYTQKKKEGEKVTRISYEVPDNKSSLNITTRFADVDLR